MKPAAAIYDGTVMHARMKPFGHRFTYRVWSLLIDLDRIDEALASVPIMSRNRFNLVSFHDRDHGTDDGTSLRDHVERLLAAAGHAKPARICLLCYPRVLGFTFNPISIYYCYGADERLSALVYEVRNTFGEKHTYVCPIAPGEVTAAGVRQQRDKLFFVSPFLGFGLTYRFRLNDPDDGLTLRILEVDEAGAPVLAATFSGKRLPLTARTLARVSVTAPLLGLKVVAGIHWEALKLWMKGAKLVARPAAPPSASVGTPHRFIDPAHGPTAYDTKMTAPSDSRKHAA